MYNKKVIVPMQKACLLLFAWLAYSSAFRVLADVSDSQVLSQVSWAALTGWNSSTDMCNWFGVTCTGERVKRM